MNRLSQLTKHYVVATKYLNSCSKRTDQCLADAKTIAKISLVLEVYPEIIYKNWRAIRPTINVDYMGTEMIFDTEQLLEDIDTSYGEVICCK